MKIEVQNNAPSVKVSVTQNSDGSFAILLAQAGSKTLGEYKPGETVTLGDREYIVLDHTDGTTALLDLNKVGERNFDDDDGDYETSDVRKYLNNKYYKELCSAVGKDNVIKHMVNLEADDGSNKGAYCEDFVSLITTENYRRYREHIPAVGYPWWTATRVTTADKDYARVVCYVRSLGFLFWYDCGCSRGVRPFCILKSSVLVS